MRLNPRLTGVISWSEAPLSGGASIFGHRSILTHAPFLVRSLVDASVTMGGDWNCFDPSGRQRTVRSNMSTHGLRILLIDDDVDDQFLAQLALEKVLPPKSSVAVARNGDEAIAYMIGEGVFADRDRHPFPSLVITDLKMPNGDGFDVLEFLQNNPAWNVVPRLMFSSSGDADDVRTAYMLGASAYHVKPMGRPELERRMRSIVEYWAGSEVPPVDRTGRVLPTTSTGRLGARYPKPPAGGAAMERP